MGFAHLHVHTEYSLLDGSNKISEYVARVKELGMDSAAITDHGVMYGVIDFYKEAKAQGINPVIGCEVYVAPGSRFDKEVTGGEPLVRKADIIKLCEKHNECAFHCYTNGTLVDQAFCDEMKRVGNLSLSISLEGFEDANDFRRGEGVYNKVIQTMDLLHENGLIFGNSVCYTRKNMDAVTSDEFFDLLIEHGSRFAWYFHLMPVGMNATPELMPTSEQREHIYHRIREVRGFTGGKEIFVMDFQNDGEFVGGCIAGGRNYCHINPKGDVEPCVFVHYSGANIREKSLLECLKQPLFMAYRDGQPFNENMLRPCPMLENPEILQRMVQETGAHSTDVEEAEPVEHLCGKCMEYACEWKETADKLWSEHPYQQKGYTNFKKK